MKLNSLGTIMIEPFIEFLSKYIELSEEEIQTISEHVTTKSFKKGTILLDQGRVAKESYLVLKGCVFSYYSVDGEVKVTEFFFEKQPITPISYTTGSPSEYYLECLEDSILAIATTQSTEELMRKVPRLAPLGTHMLEDQITDQRTKYDEFIKLSAEERYQNLQKKAPDLLNRVPQYLVASYLGIKPESLSRIRKRLHKNT